MLDTRRLSGVSSSLRYKWLMEAEGEATIGKGKEKEKTQMGDGVGMSRYSPTTN